MEALKDSLPQLKDSDGCISFIGRINKLVDVMNARMPYDALKLNSSNEKVFLFLFLYKLYEIRLK